MTRYYYNSIQLRRTFSVYFSNFKIILPAFFLATAFFVSSCEEKPTPIGSDLLPGKDLVIIKSTDSIGVGIYTQYIDSVNTYERKYSYLGMLSDPYFGTTTTDFVAQLRLTQVWPGGGKPTVDSVKFFMEMYSAKGTLDSTIHRIKISEIGEMLSSATSYYSNRDPQVIKDLGTYNVPAITKDTIQSVAITIPNTIGEYLMRDTTKLLQADNSANDFRSFFKGVHITLVDSPEPLVITFDFSTPPFDIMVYYHNNNGNKLTYDFVINSSSERYNRYHHDFNTALPATRIKHINDGVKDTLSYLQGFNGVYPKIIIPGLKTYRDSMPISVNMAKLTIPVYFDNNIFTATNAPAQIFLSYIAADSTRNILPDLLLSSAFFDGTFNSTGKTYTFNIASFVQLYLEGKIPKPEVEMYFPEGEYKNVIFKSNKSSLPVKFEFTYTRF